MSQLPSIDTLFASAIEIEEPEEREAFLERACGDNPDVKRQVKRLVQAHFHGNRILDEPAHGFVATLDEICPEALGTMIGPYKLLEQIGEGGFGVVFMAEQTEPVRRKVALKVLKPGMDTKQIVARFEAERQALAMMDHPNIAKVFDGGQTPSGRPYFVMELVRGIPITEFCDQHHLDIRERLDLFVKVCQAVQHAHQKGVIHRDIKPSNVLVVSHDGTPVPKVIDFGIAKAMSGNLTDKTLFTGFAQMIGTPLYMSPEQAGQSGLDVDTRSDIYSLGVTLYELLTGTTPFDKEQLSKLGYDELRRIIREEEPPKPSTRLSTLSKVATTASTNRKSDPHRLSQLVRGELDWIVMKALEKDRNRRYETANAFAADVQRYLNDEPVQACPPSATYRFKKFARRNKVAVSMVGIITISLALVVASLLLANDALADKQLETQRAKEKTDEALGIRTKALADKTTALTDKSIALLDLKNAHESLERKAYYQGITLGELRWLNADVARAEKELANCPEHLRGWEWHYLKRLCRTELQVFKEDNPVGGIHVSPDGQRLAAGGSLPYVNVPGKGGINRQTIKIWSLQAGQLLFHHVGPLEDGVEIKASPNCVWVAVGQENKTVDLWDVRTVKKAWTVRGTRPGALSRILFSPNDEHLATRTDAHEVQLWDLKTGKLLRTLPGHGAELFGWAFSHDGRQVVTSGYSKAGKNRGEADATVIIWDVVSGKMLYTLVGGLNHPSFSPKGRLLAGISRGADGVVAGAAVQVWDLTQPEGKLVHTLQLKDYRFSSLIFSPDGQQIATQTYPTNPVSLDEELTVWSVKSGQALYSLRARMGLRNLRFSADSQRLAGTEGAVVRIWAAVTGQELLTLRGHSWINSIDFLADGRLASAGDNEIRIWDTANPQEARVVRHTAQAFSVASSPDGRLGASATYKEIKVWEAATGTEVASWSFSPGGPTQIHFSPDSTRVAAVEHIAGKPSKYPVKVWEATTGKEIFALEGTGFNRSLAFSPDGKWIATAGGDWGNPSVVFIWDSQTGKVVKVLLGIKSELHNVTFSPDSKLVAASAVRELKIWDLTTGNEVISKQLPSVALHAVASNRDAHR